MKGWVSDNPAAKVGGLREIHGWNHGFQPKKNNKARTFRTKDFMDFFRWLIFAESNGYENLWNIAKW